MTASHRRRAGAALIASALALSVACAKEEPKPTTTGATTGGSAAATTVGTTPSTKATDGTKPGTTSTSKATRTTGASGGGSTNANVYTDGDDGDAAAALLLQQSDLGPGTWTQEAGTPNKEPNPLSATPGCEAVKDDVDAVDGGRTGQAKTEFTDTTSNSQISSIVEVYEDADTARLLYETVEAPAFLACMTAVTKAGADAQAGKMTLDGEITTEAATLGVDAEDLGADWVVGITQTYGVKSGNGRTTTIHYLFVAIGSGDTVSQVTALSLTADPQIDDILAAAATRLTA